MKNFSLQIVIIIFSTICFSCQKENKTQIAFEETMEMHDIAMVKMEQMFLLKRSLIKLKDSISQLENVDSTMVENLMSQIIDLEDSDEAMMSWMAQFKTTFQDDDNETNIKYYNDQMELINEVNSQIDNAIETANATLGN